MCLVCLHVGVHETFRRRSIDEWYKPGQHASWLASELSAAERRQLTCQVLELGGLHCATEPGARRDLRFVEVHRERMKAKMYPFCALSWDAGLFGIADRHKHLRRGIL